MQLFDHTRLNKSGHSVLWLLANFWSPTGVGDTSYTTAWADRLFSAIHDNSTLPNPQSSVGFRVDWQTPVVFDFEGATSGGMQNEGERLTGVEMGQLVRVARRHLPHNQFIGSFGRGGDSAGLNREQVIEPVGSQATSFGGEMDDVAKHWAFLDMILVPCGLLEAATADRDIDGWMPILSYEYRKRAMGKPLIAHVGATDNEGYITGDRMNRYVQSAARHFDAALIFDDGHTLTQKDTRFRNALLGERVARL